MLGSADQLAKDGIRHPIVRIEQKRFRVTNSAETFHYTDDLLIIDLGSRCRDAVQEPDHHAAQKAGNPWIGNEVGFSRAWRRHAAFPVSVHWARIGVRPA